MAKKISTREIAERLHKLQAEMQEIIFELELLAGLQETIREIEDRKSKEKNLPHEPDTAA